MCYTSVVSDVAKTPYLHQTPKGWKLRRRVPSHLAEAVGKKEWIKRLGGKSRKDAEKQARIFAVYTDQEIEKAERHLNSSPAARQLMPEVVEPGFNNFLTSDMVSKLVENYFRAREEKIDLEGGYRPSLTGLDLEEAVDEYAFSAAYDHARAFGDRDLQFEEAEGQLEDANLKKAMQYLIDVDVISVSAIRSLLIEQGLDPGSKAPKSVPHVLRQNSMFRRLAQKIASADAEISRRLHQALSENRPPTLEDMEFEGALEPRAGNRNLHFLGRCTELFLESQQSRISPKRFSQLKIPMRVLVEEFGENFDISAITEEHFDAIVQLLPRIPSYASRHYKGLSLRQAAEKANLTDLRYDEAKKNLATIKRFFAHARKSRWVTSSPAQFAEIDVPARAKKISEKKSGYEPFTLAELNQIFSRPLYRGCENDERGINKPGDAHPRRSRFWLPLVSLFSGLRMQEVLQLERSDFSSFGSGYCIHVTDAVHGADYEPDEYIKCLKTDMSLRTVPIHPELVRIGFVDFAMNSNREWLFPDRPKARADKMSDQFSKRFSTFLKPTGVWVPRRKVFHSFRGTFNDAMRAGGVPRELREPIMGWKYADTEDGTYGSGHLASNLLSEVSKVKYEDLDFSFLHTDAGLARQAACDQHTAPTPLQGLIS